ncbi:MAG: FHA domain-containing protein, partial [Pseudomonadota bacterium]
STGAFEAAYPAVAQRHDMALVALGKAFDQRQPIATLVGEGHLELCHVVRRFVASLGIDVASTIISKTRPDVSEGLQALARGLGFDLSELSVADRYSVLTLFLENQRAHGRRTVIAIENAECQPDWLIDLVGRLVEREAAQKLGLMIVLSGSPERVRDRLSDCNSSFLYHRSRQGMIELPSFSAAETAIFVRDRLRTAAVGDSVAQFDFDAVERLHEITRGIPDDVASLCCRCLVRADLDSADRISAAGVDAAAAELDLGPEGRSARIAMDETLTEELIGINVVRHRLVVRLDGNWLNDRIVENGSILIGRAAHADVRLSSNFVSRSHALISMTEHGHEIRDLGSRNGTYVGQHRIKRQLLAPDDVIRIGQYVIEYQSVAGHIDVPVAS